MARFASSMTIKVLALTIVGVNVALTQSSAATPTTPTITIPATCSTYLTALPGNTLGWYTTGISTSIPNVGSVCQSPGRQCYIQCPNNEPDSPCSSLASAQAETCAPQWSAYSCSSSSYYQASVTGTYTLVTTYIYSATTTFTTYPTTIPTNQTFSYFSNRVGLVYITPVWVFGDPVTSLSATTGLPIVDTVTRTSSYDETNYYTEPPPFCSVTSWGSVLCDRYCQIIVEGTAQVYYWPDQTPGPDGAFPAVTTDNPSTTVINGNTLTSPSVYVSVPKAYATNFCRVRGAVYTNALLSYEPASISTAYYSTGAVGVNPYYSAVYNFADLVPPVNPSAYERQLSCMSECRTIYPYYAPLLAFPTQLPNIVPEWSGCSYSGFGIENYPPIALGPTSSGSLPPAATATPQPEVSTTTVPTSFVTSIVSSASPCSTPAPETPTATTTTST